jgi:hypothetical protein
VDVAVGVGGVKTMLLVNPEVQLAVPPPPLAEPLHCSTFRGRAAVVVEPAATLQVTVAPPPLPEPLHCVIVAPLVDETGLQVSVVPVVAEPTHSLTVAAAGVIAARVVMLLVMVAWQVTPPPPAFSEPFTGLTGPHC